MINSIDEFQLDTDVEGWNELSDEAKDFLRLGLRKDPGKRGSAREMLNHPWLSDATCGNPPSSLTEEALQDLQANLSNFARAPPLKKTVISLLSGLQTPSSTADTLKKTFIHLDRDLDGFVTLDDLNHAFTSAAKHEHKHDDGPRPSSASDLKSLFNQLDRGRRGRLDLAEFMEAAADHSQLATREKLEELFKLVDTDGDGRIQTGDLGEAVAAKMQREEEIAGEE